MNPGLPPTDYISHLPNLHQPIPFHTVLLYPANDIYKIFPPLQMHHRSLFPNSRRDQKLVVINHLIPTPDELL